MWKLVTGAAALWLAATLAVSQEKEGYYYPPIGSEERFERTMLDVPPSDREARLGFIVETSKAQLDTPNGPRFVIFAKGGEAEHMIIVALDDEVFATLFRARAVLAQLTNNLRGSEFYEATGRISDATLFDLAKLLGFEDVVVSDGREWSHRVLLR